MKAAKEFRWIRDSDFTDANPARATLKGVIMQGKEKILQLQLANSDLCQMSVYSDNWNRLVEKLGDETDNWLEKPIGILQFTNAKDGKKIKQLQV